MAGKRQSTGFEPSRRSGLKKLAQAIPENLYLSSDGATNYGVPYNLEGYGYLVDKQMITDIFGEENTEAF